MWKWMGNVIFIVITPAESSTRSRYKLPLPLELCYLLYSPFMKASQSLMRNDEKSAFVIASRVSKVGLKLLLISSCLFMRFKIIPCMWMGLILQLKLVTPPPPWL